MGALAAWSLYSSSPSLSLHFAPFLSLFLRLSPRPVHPSLLGCPPSPNSPLSSLLLSVCLILPLPPTRRFAPMPRPLSPSLPSKFPLNPSVSLLEGPELLVPSWKRHDCIFDPARLSFSATFGTLVASFLLTVFLPAIISFSFSKESSSPLFFRFIAFIQFVFLT